MELFDSHVHYEDAQFNEDRDERLEYLRNTDVKYVSVFIRIGLKKLLLIIWKKSENSQNIQRLSQLVKWVWTISGMSQKICRKESLRNSLNWQENWICRLSFMIVKHMKM